MNDGWKETHDCSSAMETVLSFLALWSQPQLHCHGRVIGKGIWMMQSPYYWGYKDNSNACVECFHKKTFQIPSKL